MKSILDLKVDFIFKNIFGAEKNLESEKIRSLESKVKEIKKAKDELIRISNDDKERELYEMRQKAIMDELNALSKAKEEGVNEQINITIKNMLELGLEKEIIAKSLGITINEIENFLEINNVSE